MANKLFCANCGAGYDEDMAYCPMCGISTSRQYVRSFTRAPQVHCTVCGAQTGPRDTYCTACGIECGDYIPGSGGGSSVLSGGGGFAGAKNLVPELLRAKDKTVYMPAVVYAVVAVAAGLILSLIVNLIFADALKDSVQDLLSSAGAPTGDSSLGMITVWLFSNLGGLFMSIKQRGESMSVSIAIGLIILAIIPIAALIGARFARKAFIDSQYPGKSLTLIDALLGAAIFAVVNVIISLFPSPISNALKEAVAGSGASISVGARVIPLFLFSLALAFVVALPSLKGVMNSIGEKNRAAGLSCAAGASFLRDVLLCGLVGAVVMLGYMMIKSSSQVIGTDSKVALLVLLPNLAIWGASFFTGGSFSISGDLGSIFDLGSAKLSVGALGISVEGSSYGISWLGGLLLLVVGVWIAVTSVYRLLRNEQLDTPKIAGAVAVPAVLMWLVSLCASIGITVSATSGTGIAPITSEMTTALFLNLVLCAVFMGVAVGVVYLAKKNPQLDNIVAKLATTPFACCAAAVATLITCLTVTVK